ncbi:hypothetical protein ACFVXG_15705 [Kitasatospora sp. NPDC058162]|uniref:hypothetical protein n=1 Tax=Kitasatospora sp. NPDC058162 TaxID=3346362 RepID=UPI0036DB64B3
MFQPAEGSGGDHEGGTPGRARKPTKVFPPEGGLLAQQDGIKSTRAALLAGLRRFPRRALRLLAEAAVASTDPAEQQLARQLLTGRVAVHRATALELLPKLTPEQAALVEPLTDLGERVPEVGPDSLPELFTSPPWKRPAPAARTCPPRGRGTTPSWRPPSASASPRSRRTSARWRGIRFAAWRRR